MPETYHIKNDSTAIKYKADVSTIGNASTVPRLRSADASQKNLSPSPPTKNGSIPKRELGKSDELIGSVLIYDTAILLDGLTNAQMDQAFNSLIISYTLFGGLNGEQTFQLEPAEKLLFKEHKLIVTSKEIKLVFP
jgi:hypothetical protein